jgi:5,10-methylene-tetrahydrofolate dehydrogenase/Methenyl tetrahydrofolate cyclohydrolase
MNITSNFRICNRTTLKRMPMTMNRIKHSFSIATNCNSAKTTRRNTASALLHDNPCQDTERYEQDPFLAPSVEMVKEVADSIRSNVREYTRHHKLKLVGITAAQNLSKSKNFVVDQGADTYSECISRTCEEDGIEYEAWRVMGETMSTAHLQMQTLIQRANHLMDIDGVLVYYPLFNKPLILGVQDDDDDDIATHKWSLECQDKQIQNGCQSILMRNKHKWPCICYKTIDDFYRDSIHPSRDVEGLCSEYHSRKKFRDQSLYVDRYDGFSPLDAKGVQDNSSIFPCTALAVVRILKRCLGNTEYDSEKPIGRRLEGVTVTIFNRSQIVGRPLASLLANDGACVYSVDEHSVVMIKPGVVWNRCFLMKKDIRSCVEKSSIIVTGVPSSTFRIPTGWIKPNSTVVNVASEPNIDVNELAKIPGIQYIPAVGKVTVALLEHNLVQLHKKKCCS